MATLARYQAFALDDAGNVLTLPSVEVRVESTGLLAIIFSDRAGATPLSNPFTGGSDGLVAFHVAGGAYKVTVTQGVTSRVFRYVAVGTGAEIDNIYSGALAPITPAANDGAPLGSPSLQWSDLFLASGGTIVFNADISLTHSADLLAFTGGNYSFAGNVTVTSGAIQGRMDPRLSSAASGDVSPDISVTDYYVRTALSAACAINAPTGTPVAGDKLIFRFKDNGTARALTWNAIFRNIGAVAPTTTVIGKTTYVGAVYNATDTKWDVLAVNTEA